MNLNLDGITSSTLWVGDHLKWYIMMLQKADDGMLRLSIGDLARLFRTSRSSVVRFLDALRNERRIVYSTASGSTVVRLLDIKDSKREYSMAFTDIAKFRTEVMAHRYIERSCLSLGIDSFSYMQLAEKVLARFECECLPTFTKKYFQDALKFEINGNNRKSNLSRLERTQAVASAIARLASEDSRSR